ncbi:hypothetical protein I4U23_005205 [Adineta vaga]|nr:hypothetical protein I4U23_005205 [Adineta vaga]
MDSVNEFADQLVNNKMQVSQLHVIQQLDALVERNNAIDLSKSFSNTREQEMARCIQTNARGWADTAKNCLEIGEASLQYRNAIEQYKRDEIQPDVAKKSYDNLTSKLQQVVPDPQHLINKTAENSTFLWHIATLIGSLAAIDLVILAKMK